jgi:hypothetical protein
MKKIDKAHFRWMKVKPKVKPMSQRDVLSVLQRIMERSPFCFGMHSGMRISLLNKNGSLFSGYVIYKSELGGYGIVSRVNVDRNKSTIMPIDIHNVIAIEYSNKYICGRNGDIQKVPVGYVSDEFCPLIQDVTSHGHISRNPYFITL